MKFESITQMQEAIATFEEVRTAWNGMGSVKMPLWRRAYAQLFGREPTTSGCSSCFQRDVAKMKQIADELRLRIAAEQYLTMQDNPGFDQVLAPNGNVIDVKVVEPGAPDAPTSKPKRKAKK